MTTQPLYRTIAQDLGGKIKNEIYQKDTLLPTESKLCNLYNVSRVTIRQSIQILVEKKYIRKVQGSGSRVIYSNQKNILDRSSKIISFSEIMRSIGKNPSYQILKFEMTFANSELAKDLDLNLDEAVFYYERIMKGNEMPYCLESGYLPIKYFPDLTIDDLVNSKLDYIERKKHYAIGYSHQTVLAILADSETQEILALSAKIPLLDITYITYDVEGHPLEKTRELINSNIYPAHFLKNRK